MINYFSLYQDQKKPPFSTPSHQLELFIPLQSPVPQVQQLDQPQNMFSGLQNLISGNLTECGCDNRGQGKSTPEGWKWGGCRYINNEDSHLSM